MESYNIILETVLSGCFLRFCGERSAAAPAGKSNDPRAPELPPLRAGEGFHNQGGILILVANSWCQFIIGALDQSWYDGRLDG
jgi:hypothetical protein